MFPCILYQSLALRTRQGCSLAGLQAVEVSLPAKRPPYLHKRVSRGQIEILMVNDDQMWRESYTVLVRSPVCGG